MSNKLKGETIARIVVFSALNLLCALPLVLLRIGIGQHNEDLDPYFELLPEEVTSIQNVNILIVVACVAFIVTPLLQLFLLHIHYAKAQPERKMLNMKLGKKAKLKKMAKTSLDAANEALDLIL